MSRRSGLRVGVGGLLFRTVHLFFIKDVQTGLVWATKILTDPFHDVKLYHRAPYYLLRGELIDPGIGDEWAEEAPRTSAEDAGEYDEIWMIAQRAESDARSSL